MGGGAQYFELQRVAKMLGVTINALDRRIKRGDLPEAIKLDDSDDTEWVVHRDALAPIAEREGWVIDLRDLDEAVSSHPSASPGRPQEATDQGAAPGVEETPTQPMATTNTDGTNIVAAADDDSHTEATAEDPDLEGASNGADNKDTLVVSHGNGEAKSIFSGLDDSLNELLERLLTMSSDLTDAVIEKERALQKVETHERTISQHETKIIDLNKVIEGQEAEMTRVVADLAEANTGLKVAEALAEERAIQIDEMHEELDQQRTRHALEVDRHRAQATDLRRRLESTSSALGWWSRRKLRN